jgi:hypothetical protein
MDLSEFKSYPPLLLDPVYEGKIVFEKRRVVSDESEIIRKKLKELGSRREKNLWRLLLDFKTWLKKR